MQDGASYLITNDDLNSITKYMISRGNNFPRIQLSNKSWVFLNYIVSITPHEIVEYEEVKTDTIADENFVAPASQDELLERIKELNSCEHVHETLYHRSTQTGDKFFKVCDKCGRRSRYIKAEVITDIDKINAKEWSD